MSDSEAPSARPMFHGIQALRGVFSVLVVCHHMGVQSENYWNHEWLGGLFSESTYRVDFFFVLSGFVLWTAHCAEAGRPRAWLGFIRKRLWRLYPLLLVLTMVKVLLLWLVPGRSSESYELLPSLLALPQKPFPIIVAAWFLPFEIYFTLALAACLALPRWASLPVLLTWAAGLSLAGLILGVVPSTHGTGFLLHPSVLEFAAGALAAECVRRQIGGGRLPGMLLFGIALAGFAAGASDHSWVAGHPVLWQKLFWALVFSVGIAGLTLWERSVKAQNWRFKDVFLLGRANYSIFLSHGIVLMALSLFMNSRFANLGGGWLDLLLLLMVAVSVFVGMIVWRYIEMPLNRWSLFSSAAQPRAGGGVTSAGGGRASQRLS